MKITIAWLLLSLLPLPLLSQLTVDQFGALSKTADQYTQERRFPEALDTLQRLYSSRPDPNILCKIGVVHLALGRFPEADAALNTCLSAGGMAFFTVQHQHNLGGNCSGPLVLSADHIWFNGRDKKCQLDSARSEISEYKTYTSENTNPVGANPFLFLKTIKNWRFVYMLYGPGNYQVDLNTYTIFYKGQELTQAERATEMLAKLIGQGPIAPVQTTKEIEIKPGMSRDDVLLLLGQPTKSIVFGDKTIFRYPDVTIELQQDKVIEVKVN